MPTKFGAIVAADKNLTFRLLAKLINKPGYSATALQEMAAGTKPMRPDQIEVIAQVLEVDPDDLRDL